MEPFDYTKLSVDERISLVAEIWDSIAEDTLGLELSDDEKQELDRRAALMESGQMPMYSWDEVKQRLLKDFG